MVFVHFARIPFFLPFSSPTLSLSILVNCAFSMGPSYKVFFCPARKMRVNAFPLDLPSECACMCVTLNGDSPLENNRVATLKKITTHKHHHHHHHHQVKTACLKPRLSSTALHCIAANSIYSEIFMKWCCRCYYFFSLPFPFSLSLSIPMCVFSLVVAVWSIVRMHT